MLGLAILLRSSDEGGGGDLHQDLTQPVIGRWAGDRIVVAGDYDADGKWLTDEQREAHPAANLYSVAADSFREVSADVIPIMEAEGVTIQKW